MRNFKILKKIFSLSLFLLLSLVATAERYVVSSKDGYTNLREQANVNSKIIKELKNDTEMVVWERIGDWYSVGVINEESNDEYTDGYVHKSQVKLHPETYIIFSNEGYVNVRAEASTISDIQRQLENNVVVTKIVSKSKEDWCYIEYDEEDGTAFDYGYVHKSQLKKYEE